MISLLVTVTRIMYPGIKRHAVFMTSLFASTYLCEQVFTRMKHVKCMTRLHIIDRHLETLLCVVTFCFVHDIGVLFVRSSAKSLVDMWV